MRIVLITLFMLLSCQAFSQVQPFTLDNGLKILVKEDHRAPIVITMIWYNVGSADEPGGLSGASHVLEHLMFKGTTKYPKGMFSKTIARLGGQENALTSNDYTAFYEKTAASHLAVNLELEADRMQHLLLNEDEFSKEIKVIQEERRLRTDNNPQALTFERFLATAHLSAPYQHPVIGWMTDLKHLSVQDARTWYQRYYAPNNATLVVVGDVQPTEVYSLAKHYFGGLAQHPQSERLPQKEPPRLGKKRVIVHAPAQLPLLMIGYTVPTVKSSSAKEAQDPYALEIVAAILDAGDSGRFSSQLVRGKQIASNIDTYYNLYARYQTQFIIYGTPSRRHSTTELRQSMISEIKRLQTELVSITELNRVKNQIIAQKTFEKDSAFGQAMELGLLETTGIGWKAADTYIQQIKRITPEAIQAVALRYFQEKNMTEGLLQPIHPSDHS